MLRWYFVLLSIFFVSCSLLFPPQFYDSIINHSANNSSQSDTGSKGSVTLYIVGISNANLCLWKVDANGSYQTIINSAAGGGGRPFLSNDTLFIPGNDGSSGCYWTILTNFGSLNKTTVSGTSTLHALQIDEKGTVWSSGNVTSDQAAYYSNTVQIWINPSLYVSVGGIQVVNDIVYMSYAGDSTLWVVTNAGKINPEPVAGRAGGLVVTNGVIYAVMKDDTTPAQCLYISSNQGASWIKTVITNGILLYDVGNAIAYDAGTIYLSGSSIAGYPCYWSVKSDGSVSQVLLDSSTGTANDIQIYNGVVYTAGSANGDLCYWIGTEKHTLQASSTGLGGLLLIKN